MLSFLLYLAVGGLFGSLAFFESVDDATEEVQQTLVNLVADLVAAPIKMGSLLEARNRLQGFIEKGLFECAELNVDGMPIAECSRKKEGLKAFSTTLALYSNLESNPKLTVYLNYDHLQNIASKRQTNFLLYLFLFGLIFLILLFMFLRKLGFEILYLSKELDGPASVKPSFIEEINVLRNSIREHLLFRKKAIELSTREEVSKQVAHDIRSPLSALNMVMGTLKDLPEDKRILIRGATQRINDIANDLLQKGKEFHSNSNLSPDPEAISKNLVLNTEFIPAMVDILVSEKRMQFREHSGIEIDIDLRDSFGAFAIINSTEIKRVISNLVNNAVEAFENRQGKIVVSVRRLDTAKLVEVAIKDNGKGIPEHILAKLGAPGISHGKEGTQSGSGIGIYHAKQTLEAFGGKLQIESKLGQGTTMRLLIPLAEAHAWFAGQIDLTGKTKLVSLDDDVSIHNIWSGRLQSLGLVKVEHVKIQSGDVFESFVKNHSTTLEGIQFLIDFELLNQSRTGLDLVEQLGIEKHAILVTSRYEEKSIQGRAQALGLKILPKSLAGFVPIVQEAPREEFDAVVIDDDDLILMTWKMSAEMNQKKLLVFKDPNDFFARQKTLNLSSPIYVDVNLANGVLGTDVAQQIGKAGFKNIFLATGYEAASITKSPFIKNIIGKDPVW